MKYLLELTITKSEQGDFGLPEYERIEGTSLIEVTSKLLLLIARVNAKEKEYYERHVNYYVCTKCGGDDIPF